MTDLAYIVAQTDLANATKQQLKDFVKRIRESWGKAIDLRKADAIALRQYLEDYLTAQATEPAEDDVIGGAAATVTDAIFAEAEATVIAGGEAPSCDVLEGAHNGSCCDTAMMPYYVSANYSDEKQGNYWFSWWAAFNFAKRQLVGATEARKHVVVTPKRKLTLTEIMARPMPEPDPETEKACLRRNSSPAKCRRELAMLEELFYSAPPAPAQAVQPHPEQPTSPAIIGLCLLTTIALIAALIASVTVWAIRKVRDTRLVQKGFRAAASAINTRRPKARGFAGA